MNIEKSEYKYRDLLKIDGRVIKEKRRMEIASCREGKLSASCCIFRQHPSRYCSSKMIPEVHSSRVSLPAQSPSIAAINSRSEVLIWLDHGANRSHLRIPWKKKKNKMCRKR